MTKPVFHDYRRKIVSLTTLLHIFCQIIDVTELCFIYRDLSAEDSADIVNGMGEWISNMKDNEKMTNGSSEKDLPPVRGGRQATTSKFLLHSNHMYTVRCVLYF